MRYSLYNLHPELEVLAVCRNSTSLRLAPTGTRLSASKIALGDFVRFSLGFVPFMQYAG